MAVNESDEIVEILSKGYHNAIDNSWVQKMGGPHKDWNSLPQTSTSRRMGESKEFVRGLMKQAISELEEAGFTIVKKE